MSTTKSACVLLFLVLIVSPQFIQPLSFAEQGRMMKGLLAKKAQAFKQFEKNSGVDQVKWLFEEILQGDIKALVKLNRTSSAESISEILTKVQHRAIFVFISSVEKKVNLESSFRLQPGKHAGPMVSVHHHLNKIAQQYTKARGNVPFPAISIGVHNSDKAFVVFDQATHTFLLNSALVSEFESRVEEKEMEKVFSQWFDLFENSLSSYNKATHGPLANFLMKETERFLPTLTTGNNGTSVWFCLACVVALSYVFPIAWNYGAFYLFEEVCEAFGGDDATCGTEAIEFLLVTGVGFLPLFAYEIFKVCGFKNPQNCRNNQVLVK